MAAERNIRIYQGDTYIHEVRVRDDANTAINISSRTYAGQIRKTRTSNVVIANFTTSITNAANGVFNFSLSSNITSNIQSGVYYYDIQETNGSIVTTLLTGRAEVEGEVTRAG